ncbi:MAG: hypothetical protein KJN67_05085 [Pontiella sp.]|nr:hypothetical protein [Pontiella sp.]
MELEQFRLELKRALGVYVWVWIVIDDKGPIDGAWIQATKLGILAGLRTLSRDQRRIRAYLEDGFLFVGGQDETI